MWDRLAFRCADLGSARGPRALGVGAVLALSLTACGQSPANVVKPLTPLTRVYAVERGSVYADQVDAKGKIVYGGVDLFRDADRPLTGVIADQGGRFLYGYSEDAGEIWAYALDAKGGPSLVLGSPFVPKTPHVIHALAISPTATYLYAAGERPGVPRGDVTVFRIDPSSGALSEIADSPFRAGVQPYRVWSDPDGAFVYVANNGSLDPWRKQSLSVFGVDPASGALVSVPGSAYETPTFVGYLQFHPSRRLLYATAGPFFLGYSIATDGSLTDLQIPNDLSGIPEGSEVLALRVTADGNYLYAIENNGLAVGYRIDSASGMLDSLRVTRAAQGFSAATFHRRQPLAVVLGRETIALNVHRLEQPSGKLVPASPAVALAKGFEPYAGGARLFFDASGRVLCVVVNDKSDPANVRVRLLTYRLCDAARVSEPSSDCSPLEGSSSDSAWLEGPVDNAVVGEGSHPAITVVYQGMEP